jgi:monoamine oxidase
MHDCDVLIIGAGHNALICAGYLAQAGYKVLVLERRHKVGGAVVTVRARNLAPTGDHLMCDFGSAVGRASATLGGSGSREQPTASVNVAAISARPEPVRRERRSLSSFSSSAERAPAGARSEIVGAAPPISSCFTMSCRRRHAA